MGYLLVASLLWAFSFGLIKTHLQGLDASFVAWVRLALSFFALLPFLRLRDVRPPLLANLLAVGAIQYGFMYVLYLRSFHYLAAHEVAVFTIFTPLYVTLLHDLFARRFHVRFLASAALAVAGAGIVAAAGKDVRGVATGFGLVQLSNLCFAYGQIRYRMLMAGRGDPTGATGSADARVFAILYLGAALAAALPACLRGGWTVSPLSPTQLAVLLYLGLAPSGLGFLLWNVGARRVNPGVLAVFNNVKIPLAVLAALLLFGERARPWPLLTGAGLIAIALALNSRWERRAARSTPETPKPAGSRPPASR
jgi:drug/metabolite transporter (DMT)-like permease